MFSYRKDRTLNAKDILIYGQRTVLQTIDGFPEGEWETPGVCGVWSAKNVISHLASYEMVYRDVLSSFLGNSSTPTLDEYLKGPEFNDAQVDMRNGKSPSEALAELNAVHDEVIALIPRIAVEKLREVGTLPWYGKEYSLDDYIVYGNYGHKREHSAQIAAFLDELKR
jgi:hypothetical protein